MFGQLELYNYQLKYCTPLTLSVDRWAWVSRNTCLWSVTSSWPHPLWWWWPWTSGLSPTTKHTKTKSVQINKSWNSKIHQWFLLKELYYELTTFQIVAATCLVQESFSIDKPAPKTPFQQHFCGKSSFHFTGHDVLM